MPQMANYALPVYEAVVSGLTLRALQEAESRPQECDNQKQAEELLSKFGELLAKFTETDFAEAKRDSIGFIAAGLAFLVSISRDVVKAGLEQIEEMPESRRTAFKVTLAGIWTDADRTEGLAEAWFMGMDEELVLSLRRSLAESRPRDQEDIPDWRDVLAKINN
jgi:hypothetical protein